MARVRGFGVEMFRGLDVRREAMQGLDRRKFFR